ncbi:MAG: carbohydrate binding family 9 domain-containing protein [Candidatus Aminicenantes bacterium]|nr:carbohydrate binding family 9 domain-containing protein [Candidatus Aminicenantes bacterium]
MKRLTFGATGAFAILLCSILLASILSAEELTAVRVKEGPKVDGLLTDPAWQSAFVITGFRMVEPRPGDDPSEKTEARVLYDDASLYIGVYCHDSEPARISANTMTHDSGNVQSSMGYGGYGHGPQTSSDDVVRVLLDPFQDKRNAYIFFVNSRGARGEGLVYAGSSSLNWDGIWEADSRRLEDGWSTEIRIPFKTISFRPGLTVWGLNIERTIARKMEVIRLSGTTRNSNFYNPNEAAALQGIEGIKQGLGITFRPYGLASASKNNLVSGTFHGELDGGFDLYKSFTPNLVGVASYNMDFAETEVDERRINLTRFPLFFPEKRMFFLEGSEVFSFSSSVSFMPFFSRRIGLFEGAQIPVRFGAKLYGKVGNTNLAVLDVQTGAYGDLGGRNLLAARMTQNIFAQSKVGWIFTNGSPTGERNSLAGVDFNYSSSKFLGDKNIMLAAWGAYNWNEREEGRHHGFGFRADYPNDLWNVQTTYAYYGEALDPGLGYMMRQGIQTAFARVAFQPRPAGGFLGRFVRQFFFEASADYYWDLSGNLETSEINASPLGFRTQSGEKFGFSVVANRDVLPYDFEVAEGVILPAGPYDFTSFRLDTSTANHRPIVLEAGYNFGQFYSGHYDDVNLGLTLKFKGYATLALDANLVRGRLPEGRFSENVYQVKADIFLSPDLGLMNYVQFDDVSNTLGWSARVRWQISPGNEIFLVYNKNWERRWDPASRFAPLGDRGVIKISLSIRP